MMKDNFYALTVVIFFWAFSCRGQAMDYSKCSGGISLSPNNFYSLAFQGKKGRIGFNWYCEKMGEDDICSSWQNKNLNKDDIKLQ